MAVLESMTKVRSMTEIIIYLHRIKLIARINIYNMCVYHPLTWHLTSFHITYCFIHEYVYIMLQVYASHSWHGGMLLYCAILLVYGIDNVQAAGYGGVAKIFRNFESFRKRWESGVRCRLSRMMCIEIIDSYWNSHVMRFNKTIDSFDSRNISCTNSHDT